MTRKILRLGVSALVLVVKAFIYAKKLLSAFFVYIIYIPGRYVLKIFFYKVVVRFYGLYRSIITRLGWGKHNRENIFSFLFSQKLVHILVVAVTILLISINVAPKTRAGGLTETAHKTILADLIKSEFAGFEEDEQFIIESFDKEATISNLQQSYLDNLDSFRPQAKVVMNPTEEEEFGEEEILTIQNNASIVRPEIASTKKTKRDRTETVEYAVEGGDTISTIAALYEVSVSTILWENNLSSYSIIRPGDKLKILPMSGLNHKVAKGERIALIAKKYEVEEEEILTANKLTTEDKLKIGDIILVPGGRKVEAVAYAPPKRYTGFTAIKDIVNAPNATPATGNKMNWPALTKKITQYYSWRHHGLDLANKTGTPIYAADAGTVELVGWGQGYGNQIVINHGGGKKTRYAHLSKFYIKQGETVTKGQTIAAMGSTGWSTGSHLHFEVIINGTKYNPLNYIK